MILASTTPLKCGHAAAVKAHLRMVSGLCQGVWYRYLTNVLNPQVLSARRVCELYRCQWRIEDAFALIKRLLDLAYVWTGSTNAVQLQIYATLIFSAVLVTICHQVAQALGEPLKRISKVLGASGKRVMKRRR